jgi:hypothetical protein
MFRQAPTLRPATLAPLERIAWTPAERGPLLVVGPERIIRTATGLTSPRFSGFPGAGALNVLEVGDVMHRQLARMEPCSRRSSRHSKPPTPRSRSGSRYAVSPACS